MKKLFLLPLFTGPFLLLKVRLLHNALMGLPKCWVQTLLNDQLFVETGLWTQGKTVMMGTENQVMDEAPPAPSSQDTAETIQTLRVTDSCFEEMVFWMQAKPETTETKTQTMAVQAHAKSKLVSAVTTPLHQVFEHEDVETKLEVEEKNEMMETTLHLTDEIPSARWKTTMYEILMPQLDLMSECP